MSAGDSAFFSGESEDFDFPLLVLLEKVRRVGMENSVPLVERYMGTSRL